MSRGLHGVGGAQTTFLGAEGAGEQVWVVQFRAHRDGGVLEMRVRASSREGALKASRRGRGRAEVVWCEPATASLF